MSVDIGTTSYIGASDLLAAASVLGALNILAVGARFYTRTSQGIGLGLDDWLILPALILVLGMSATMITSVKKGAWGYPTPKDPEIITVSLQVEYAFQLEMIAAYGFIKLSVLSFYRRIFVSQKGGRVDILLWSMFGICGAWAICFFFLFFMGCRGHFDLYWKPQTTIDDHKCLPAFPPEKGLIISDLITDVAVLFLPFPLIWRLHMTTTRKVAVSGILLLGCVSVVASIIRMVYYFEIFATYETDVNADLDLTLARAFYWSMIEAGLGVFAACLPTLRALFGQPTVERMVASVRSAISLSSLSSSRARRRTEGEADAEVEGSRVKNEDTDPPAAKPKLYTPTDESLASHTTQDEHHPNDLQEGAGNVV